MERSAGLLQEKSASFRKYNKEDKIIKDIQLKWAEKMEELQKKGFEEKDALNIRKDATKLTDLE